MLTRGQLARSPPSVSNVYNEPILLFLVIIISLKSRETINSIPSPIHYFWTTESGQTIIRVCPIILPGEVLVAAAFQSHQAINRRHSSVTQAYG